MPVFCNALKGCSMPRVASRPRVFVAGLFVASVLVPVFGGLPAAQAQAPSSYQSSCTDISIAGATLVATCRRIDGSFNQTSIVLRGIENIDGRLEFTQPGQTASFQNSCNDIHVIGSTLTANCRRINGSFERTSLLIPEISNINGVLRY
jgi:hypothetical protein